jgi:hypothetical protein
MMNVFFNQEMVERTRNGFPDLQGEKIKIGGSVIHFLLVFLSAFKLLLLPISNSHPQSQAPGIVGLEALLSYS